MMIHWKYRRLNHLIWINQYTKKWLEIDRRHGAKVNPSLDTSKEFKEKLENELELIIAESGIKGIEYKEFIKMCEDIYKNMNGLNIAWNEG